MSEDEIIQALISQKREIERLNGELFAVRALLFYFFTRSQASTPDAIRLAFDDAAQHAENEAIRLGKAASPEHLVKALGIIEDLPNNSGKSTLVTAVRNLLSQGESVTIGQEARHNGESPIAEVLWEDSEGTERIAIYPNLDGAIFQKSGNRQRIQKKIRFVPSRRPFGSEYNTHGIMTEVDYEQNEFVNRLSNQSYFDGQLATSIASFFALPQNKTAFLEKLRKVDPHSIQFSTDNVGSRTCSFTRDHRTGRMSFLTQATG